MPPRDAIEEMLLASKKSEKWKVKRKILKIEAISS